MLLSAAWHRCNIPCERSTSLPHPELGLTVRGVQPIACSLAHGGATARPGQVPRLRTPPKQLNPEHRIFSGLSNLTLEAMTPRSRGQEDCAAPHQASSMWPPTAASGRAASQRHWGKVTSGSFVLVLTPPSCLCIYQALLVVSLSADGRSQCWRCMRVPHAECTVSRLGPGCPSLCQMQGAVECWMPMSVSHAVCV